MGVRFPNNENPSILIHELATRVSRLEVIMESLQKELKKYNDDNDFRDIQGYPGYRISRSGVVQSNRKGSVWKAISPTIQRDGILYITLYNHTNQMKIRRLASLVWRTWIGPLKRNAKINYRDGDKSNVHYENLESPCPV